MIKNIECNELYRIPISIDMIDDFYKLGELSGNRYIVIRNINNLIGVSDNLKLNWMTEYNKEWHEKTHNILKRIRTKANLESEKYTMTFDLSTKELIIVDILRSDYKALCKKYKYFINVKINKSKIKGPE